MNKPTEIYTVLGDCKPITRYYDNGFDCPYCTYPILFEEGRCGNPWCEANPAWGKEALTKFREEKAQKQAENARREREHQWAMERIKREQEAHANWRTEQIEEAKRRGTCLNCLFQSGWQRVKFIKHRGQCPKGR